MPRLFVCLALLSIISCSFLASAKLRCRGGAKAPKKYVCQPEDRNQEICPTIALPVCGYRPDIMCITTPCNHVTYNNGCEACRDGTAESYTNGNCTQID